MLCVGSFFDQIILVALDHCLNVTYVPSGDDGECGAVQHGIDILYQRALVKKGIYEAGGCQAEL